MITVSPKAPRLPDRVLTDEWSVSAAGAWACGLIVADGSLSRPNWCPNASPRLRVVLHEEDRSGIAALCDAFGIGHDRIASATGKQPGNLCALQFGHPRLWFLVHGLGMRLGDKSLIAHLPDELVLNPHAWRGVIDGDGYSASPVSRNGDHVALHLGLRSRSPALLYQFEVFVEHTIGARPGRYDHRCVCTGANAVAIIAALYLDAPQTIARKRDKALELAAKRACWEQQYGNAVTPPAARELIARVLEVL